MLRRFKTFADLTDLRSVTWPSIVHLLILVFPRKDYSFFVFTFQDKVEIDNSAAFVGGNQINTVKL